MVHKYEVTRKLQEQSGSYFVILPKLWVDSYDLKQGDIMSVIFNGIVKIKPPHESQTDTLQLARKKNSDNEETDHSPLSQTLAAEEVKNSE